MPDDEDDIFDFDNISEGDVEGETDEETDEESEVEDKKKIKLGDGAQDDDDPDLLVWNFRNVRPILNLFLITKFKNSYPLL